MARVDPRNRARYWRDPLLPGLGCLTADFTTHEYAPHSHQALVVAVTETGGSQFRSRGRTEEARSSVLLVFNPDEPHSGRMGRSGRWRYRSLYLTLPGLDALRRSLGVERQPYFLDNLFQDGALVATFLSLHRAMEAGGDPLRLRELLIGGFAGLYGRHGASGGRLPAAPCDRGRIDRVQEIIRARHEASLTLEEMGQAVDLTPFQLIGLFKRTIGMTPHAFLTQVRLDAAIDALRAGRPIAEAAVTSGFYDQSALTRNFKRCYGITPLQWVRAVRG